MSDALIPKIFASSPSGNSAPHMIKVIVVPPPSNIDQKAAFGLGRFRNNPPSTGTNNPDTINA